MELINSILQLSFAGRKNLQLPLLLGRLWERHSSERERASVVLPDKLTLPVLKQARITLPASEQDGIYQAQLAKLSQTQRLLQQSVPYKIDNTLFDIALKSVTKTQALHKAFNFIRLPFPVIWLERDSSMHQQVREELRTSGDLLMTLGDRFGWLLKEETDEQGKRAILIAPVVKAGPEVHDSFYGKAPFSLAGDRFWSYRFDEDGLHDLLQGTTLKLEDVHQYMRQSKEAVAQGAANLPERFRSDETSFINLSDEAAGALQMIFILALMNSRSRVVRIDNEQKPDLNFKVRREFNQHGVQARSLKPIVFDVARILSKRPGAGQDDQQDARHVAALSLVAGHFKVRQSGIWWWSDYVRASYTDNPVEGPPPLVERECHTVMSSPDIVLPNRKPTLCP